MPDNPFSPEGNPFSMGDGGPTGGGPTSVPGGGVTTGPAPVPETTKPRQMPGGASPTGMPVPMGAPMGGGAPGGSGPAPMPFTDPAVSGQGQNMQTNTPQPTPPTQAQAFRRAVAMRDEILVHNPHLRPEQAFFLAKQALRVMAYDPKNFNDAKNPNSPNHPTYWQRRNQQNNWNPVGPTLGPNSGYSDNDPTWARKAREIGYSGQSPAIVGGAATLVDFLWKKWKGRGQGGEEGSHDEHSVEEHEQTQPQPARPARQPGEPGRHQAPEQHSLLPQGKDTSNGRHVMHENTEPQPGQGAVTTPIPGKDHTQPGGPPTPHLHPAAPQPGESSVPMQRRQQPNQGPAVDVLPNQGPGKHERSRKAPGFGGFGFGRGKHSMVYTAAQVYGEA